MGFIVNKAKSLSNTKWTYKCHIGFLLKCRRKVICNERRESLEDIIQKYISADIVLNNNTISK